VFIAAGRVSQTCAQVLLTLENLADRSQYVNARNTFTELLAYGTIPVVNENVSSSSCSGGGSGDSSRGWELRVGRRAGRWGWAA
jgi:glutamate 5-kinase